MTDEPPPAGAVPMFADAPRWHPVWGDRGWAPATQRVAGSGWEFDLGADGLSGVSFRGVEVAERIYLGLRDLDWNTVRGRLDSATFVIRAALRAECSVGFDDGERSLATHWTVRARDDGTLVLRVRMRPLRDFVAAKLGLCVLHGQATATGSQYAATGPEGTASGVLPTVVSPQLMVDGALTAMFPPYRSLRLRLRDGRHEVAFDFSGDVYEMQDHRNWADANLKTYSTPQVWGGPWDYAAGADLVREVRVTVHPGDAPAEVGSPPSSVVALSHPGLGQGASLGLSVSVSPELLARASATASRLLGELAPRRLRIELTDELDAQARDTLRRVLDELGATIELVLVARDAAHANELVASLGPAAPIASVMTLRVAPDGTAGEATDLGPGDAAASAGWRIPGDPEVVAGTGGFFCQVNRNRPSLGGSRRLSFGISPQVHTCESRTIISNLEAVSPMAETARAIYGPGTRLRASPVRLVPAQGPFHTGHVPRPPSAPLATDARLAGTFGAAWLVGMAHRLLAAGYDSASLLDAIGPNGVIVGPDPAGVDLPPGALVLPAFHVLRALFAAERLRAVVSSGAADAVAAILLEDARGRRLLIASLGQPPCEVDISALADRHRLRWVLDERSVASAMVEPWGWGRDQARVADRATDLVRLSPFSVALLDLGPGHPADDDAPQVARG